MEELKVLIDEEKIQEKVEELAKQIKVDYEGKELVLICVLKGSIVFTVDLARKLDKKVKIDFLQVSSYGKKMISSGNIDLKLDLQESIEGKHVLVIEDIIDTGKTLKYLLEHLEQKKPASLKLCSLLDKPEKRVYEVAVDYIGFQIPDKFVVGYGLDYDEVYRNLPYIGYFD